jgi:hypothetical protein
MSESAREAHRAADRERYWWNKAHGICVKCGQNYADAGHVTCVNCYKKYKGWCLRTDPDGSKHRERTRAYRERLREEGLCQWCGKAKAVSGHAFCAACKIKYDEVQMVYNIHKRLGKGDKQ